MTVIISVGYWFSMEKRRKKFHLSTLIWIVLVIIQLFGVYLSNSMTAYAGLLLSVVNLIILLIYQNKWINKKNIHKLIFFLVLLMTFFLSNNVIFNGQLNNIFQFIEKAWWRVSSTTFGTRIVVYINAFHRILKNPIVGVGLDQVATSGVNLVQRTLGTGVHNIFLQVWYTGGLISLIGWLYIYIYYLFTSIKVIYKKITTSPLIISLAIAILSILLMDQFQDTIYQREKWLILGIFISVFIEISTRNRTNWIYENC
jgi:O-antigen ligase